MGAQRHPGRDVVPWSIDVACLMLFGYMFGWLQIILTYIYIYIYMFGCSDEWITRAYYTDLGLLVYRKPIECTDLNLGFWVLWTHGMGTLPGQVSRQPIWDSTIWYTCLVGGFNMFQIWSNNIKYVSMFNPLTWHFPEETSHYMSTWTPIYATRNCQFFFCQDTCQSLRQIND